MKSNPQNSDSSPIARRDLLLSAGVLAGGLACASAPTLSAQKKTSSKDFTYCLNTSTIRGQKLSIEEEIDVTAKAGYDAIEPWFRKINPYIEKGGSLKDLRKRIDDHGLKVPSSIGFAKWIVDDDKLRAEGLEEAKRDMDTIAQLGGTRLAAPPVGATKEPGLDLHKAGERYRALLELGDKMGIVPQVEVWGFSKNLYRLCDSTSVAIAADHPKACILTDVYHLYKGGSAFEGLRLLGPESLQVIHMNDYPDIPRQKIGDADRVFTGDGIAPLAQVFEIFRTVGAKPVLSLELFNPEYWKMDAYDCAKTGLDKLKASVAKYA
ncbi:MAG: sugar phosphate isomerase/epimerase [Verrucomicrobia bacterium]|nr:sugar phosphate isomerase/epimerase [Verrucomicrobiota bacterium]